MLLRTKKEALTTPVIVPWMMVPFFSSICTVSFVSFMRNLRIIRRDRANQQAKALEAIDTCMLTIHTASLFS